MCPVDIWYTCSAAFTMRSILIDRWYEPIASANRFVRELVTPDEFSVPMEVVCRTWPAISSGADGTQRELPSSLRQTRRQSLATSPSGSSREALGDKDAHHSDDGGDRGRIRPSCAERKIEY